jgi:hypothetical protein
MHELRREINELRFVVYPSWPPESYRHSHGGRAGLGQAVVALAGCVVVYAVYDWARDKIADWWESRAAS